jgi:hypothetical protein
MWTVGGLRRQFLPSPRSRGHVVKAMPVKDGVGKPPYMQGMLYKDGSLYYGTSRGEIVKVSPSSASGKIVREWCVPVSTRNIVSIDDYTETLLCVTADSVDVDKETGRTSLLEKETGHIVRCVSWNDTTLAQSMYRHTWYRCNVNGDMHFEGANHDDFKIKRGFCAVPDDTLQCGTFHDNMFMTMSLNGMLNIYDIHTFEHAFHFQTPFSCPTVMFVHKPTHLTDTYFIYAGNVEGELFFCQVQDRSVISHAVRRIVDRRRGAMTYMTGNVRGPVMTFADSSVVAMESMSYQIYFDVMTNSFLPRQKVCASQVGTFFVMNENSVCMQQHATIH